MGYVILLWHSLSLSYNYFEASEKSSLRFLNTQKYEIGKVHYVWKNAGFNLMAIKKADMKTRLMMPGTYVL